MRREGDTLVLEGAVTFDTVPGLADAAEEHLRQGVRRVDFGAVTDVDSTAVALALEWSRRSTEGPALQLANLPAAMQNLARLYGVSELLQSAA